MGALTSARMYLLTQSAPFPLGSPQIQRTSDLATSTVTAKQMLQNLPAYVPGTQRNQSTMELLHHLSLGKKSRCGSALFFIQFTAPAPKASHYFGYCSPSTHRRHRLLPFAPFPFSPDRKLLGGQRKDHPLPDVRQQHSVPHLPLAGVGSQHCTMPPHFLHGLHYHMVVVQPRG